MSFFPTRITDSSRSSTPLSTRRNGVSQEHVDHHLPPSLSSKCERKKWYRFQKAGQTKPTTLSQKKNHPVPKYKNEKKTQRTSIFPPSHSRHSPCPHNQNTSLLSPSLPLSIIIIITITASRGRSQHQCRHDVRKVSCVSLRRTLHPRARDSFPIRRPRSCRS